MIFTQIIAVLNIFETDDKNRQERLKKQALRAAPEPAEGVAKKTGADGEDFGARGRLPPTPKYYSETFILHGTSFLLYQEDKTDDMVRMA